MDTAIDLLFEYREYIGFGLLVLPLLLFVTSEKFRGLFKKGLVAFLIVAGLGLCYYFFTGKSPSDIPADINRFFSRQPTELEPSHRYYQDRKEHYTVPDN